MSALWEHNTRTAAEGAPTVIAPSLCSRAHKSRGCGAVFEVARFARQQQPVHQCRRRLVLQLPRLRQDVKRCLLQRAGVGIDCAARAAVEQSQSDLILLALDGVADAAAAVGVQRVHVKPVGQQQSEALQLGPDLPLTVSVSLLIILRTLLNSGQGGGGLSRAPKGWAARRREEQ